MAARRSGETAVRSPANDRSGELFPNLTAISDSRDRVLPRKVSPLVVAATPVSGGSGEMKEDRATGCRYRLSRCGGRSGKKGGERLGEEVREGNSERG